MRTTFPVALRRAVLFGHVLRSALRFPQSGPGRGVDGRPVRGGARDGRMGGSPRLHDRRRVRAPRLRRRLHPEPARDAVGDGRPDDERPVHGGRAHHLVLRPAPARRGSRGARQHQPRPGRPRPRFGIRAERVRDVRRAVFGAGGASEGDAADAAGRVHRRTVRVSGSHRPGDAGARPGGRTGPDARRQQRGGCPAGGAARCRIHPRLGRGVGVLSRRGAAARRRRSWRIDRRGELRRGAVGRRRARAGSSSARTSSTTRTRTARGSRSRTRTPRSTSPPTSTSSGPAARTRSSRPTSSSSR